MRERDILLHHPYNNFEPVLQLLEQAAEDPESIVYQTYDLPPRKKLTRHGGALARGREWQARSGIVRGEGAF